MRVALAACLACLALAGPATSATGPTLSRSPNPVGFGQTLTVRGRHWPVIEFCRRTVRIRLRSAQNAVRLGTAHVRASGRWRFTYNVRRSEVGAGRWKLVARLPCESGEDGSPNPVVRRRRLTIQ